MSDSDIPPLVEIPLANQASSPVEAPPLEEISLLWEQIRRDAILQAGPVRINSEIRAAATAMPPPPSPMYSTHSRGAEGLITPEMISRAVQRVTESGVLEAPTVLSFQPETNTLRWQDAEVTLPDNFIREYLTQLPTLGEPGFVDLTPSNASTTISSGNINMYVNTSHSSSLGPGDASSIQVSDYDGSPWLHVPEEILSRSYPLSGTSAGNRIMDRVLEGYSRYSRAESSPRPSLHRCLDWAPVDNMYVSAVTCYDAGSIRRIYEDIAVSVSSLIGSFVKLIRDEPGCEGFYKGLWVSLGDAVVLVTVFLRPRSEVSAPQGEWLLQNSYRSGAVETGLAILESMEVDPISLEGFIEACCGETSERVPVFNTRRIDITRSSSLLGGLAEGLIRTGGGRGSLYLSPSERLVKGLVTNPLFDPRKLGLTLEFTRTECAHSVFDSHFGKRLLSLCETYVQNHLRTHPLPVRVLAKDFPGAYKSFVLGLSFVFGETTWSNYTKALTGLASREDFRIASTLVPGGAEALLKIGIPKEGKPAEAVNWKVQALSMERV